MKKQCPMCRMEVHPQARVCGHCHHTFTLTDTNAYRDARGRSRLTTMALILAAIVGSIVWLNQPGNVEWLAQIG